MKTISFILTVVISIIGKIMSQDITNSSSTSNASATSNSTQSTNSTNQNNSTSSNSSITQNNTNVNASSSNVTNSSTTNNSNSNVTNDGETYPIDKTSLHCDESKLSDFKIGDNVFVCIHLLPRELRMAFNVTVDSYEVLTVTGGYIFSFKDSEAGNKNQSYAFQFGNVSTAFSSLYYSEEIKQVAALFNVVIKLDDGKISDVVWDNDCWGCALSTGCTKFNDIFSMRNASEFYNENVRKYQLILIILELLDTFM